MSGHKIIQGLTEAVVMARIAALAQEVERLRAALTTIAAFDDIGGNEHLAAWGTFTAFDEPGSVQTARAALSPTPDVDKGDGK